ncbi:hypothetical protein CPB86DRAFT_460418 [Serendipita vermifera]|nr:hypothetical protein CPB86DRAFT_460418 [Serendipita vermifera]
MRMVCKVIFFALVDLIVEIGYALEIICESTLPGDGIECQGGACFDELIRFERAAHEKELPDAAAQSRAKRDGEASGQIRNPLVYTTYYSASTSDQQDNYPDFLSVSKTRVR